MTVLNKDGTPTSVTVQGFENGHLAGAGDGRASFSYRVETPAGIVFITGDTAFSDVLTPAAEGADLVVPEAALRPPDLSGPQFDRIYAIHLLPEEIATVMNAAGPDSIALLTHLLPVPPATSFLGFEIDKVTEADFIDAVRAGGFDGPVVVGRDLYTVLLKPGKTPKLCKGIKQKCRRLKKH